MQQLHKSDLEAVVEQLYTLARLVHELAVDFDAKLRLSLTE